MISSTAMSKSRFIPSARLLRLAHGPTHPRPLPRGEQEQAYVRELSVPLLGGVRGGFMVPMHAHERREAFHEARSAAVPAASCGGVSPPARTPRGTPGELAGEDACATSAGRFMVPMHAQKRIEALHKPQSAAGKMSAAPWPRDFSSSTRGPGNWSAGLRPGALEEADCFAPDRRSALRKSLIKIKITRTTTRTIIS